MADQADGTAALSLATSTKVARAIPNVTPAPLAGAAAINFVSRASTNPSTRLGSGFVPSVFEQPPMTMAATATHNS